MRPTALVLLLAGCGLNVDRSSEALTSPRPIGDDVGIRNFASEPMYRQRVCPPGTSCFTLDMNHDGKEDLVRFDPTGAVGAPGSVAVALSNGWDFGPMRTIYAGLCFGDCLAADVNGDHRPDLLVFDRAKGNVYAALTDVSGRYQTPRLWIQGMRTADQACVAADVDGDGADDLVAFAGIKKKKPTGDVFVARGGRKLAGPPTLVLRQACGSGACRVADLDGDRRADLIEFPRDRKGAVRAWLSTPQGLKGPVRWGQGVCAGGVSCQMADFNADFKADAVSLELGGGVVDLSGEAGFSDRVFLSKTPCQLGNRCWMADVTGDGRADMVVVSSDGTTSLYHSQDSIDRIDDAGLRISLLRNDFAFRQRRWAIEELRRIITDALPPSDELRSVFPDRFPPVSDPSAPPPTPTIDHPALPFPPLPGMEPWPPDRPGAIDTAWVSAALDARADSLKAEIDGIYAALPAEGTLVWTADQTRWQVILGKVVAARTSAIAAPLAVSVPALNGTCSNTVLFDRHRDDGAVRIEGSFITRYYDALRTFELPERVSRALPELTGIEEGLRCLSEPELGALEEAFVESVLNTMGDSVARGQPALAQMVWDEALPVELLLFDAVKSFTLPSGWSLLQVRIEDGALVVPELPEAGGNFQRFLDEDRDTCLTVRCRLYKAPRRPRTLTLDSLGVWLPDLTRAGRLTRSQALPEGLLDALVKLEPLGEGDCPLAEIGFNNLTCQSMWTCQQSQELARITAGYPIFQPLGAPGSAFTHFGTRRELMAGANNCSGGSGGGGAPPGACIGPISRGRGGQFSPNPEIDHLFRCAMDSFTPGGPLQTSVDVSANFRPGCLLRNGDGDGSEPPDNPYGTQEDDDRMIRAAKEGAHFLRTGENPYGWDRERLIQMTMEQTGASRDQVLEGFDKAAGYLEGIVSGDTPLLFDDNPLGIFATAHDGDDFDHYRMHWSPRGQAADEDVITSGVPAEHADRVISEYLFIGMTHEGMHVVIDHVAPDRQRDLEWHHELIERMGLIRRSTHNCDPSSTSCRDGCGLEDARITRLLNCLAGDPAPFDPCEIAEDYCDDRRNGDAEYTIDAVCTPPALGLPPMCLAVSCDTSSSVASACCGGSGGGSGDPRDYAFFSIGPGPCPGDPDSGYSGGFGGPDIPIPPLR